MATLDSSTKSASKPIIPVRFQDAACLIALLLTLVIFFSKSTFTGNTLQNGDAISFNSFVPFLNAEKAAGEFPLWIPTIFSGMPSYGSLLVTGDRWFDLTVFAYIKVETIVKSISSSPDVFRIVFEYFVMGLGMFLYMRSRKVGRMIALFSAYALVFSSFIIAFVMMGHNTKVWAIMCAPYLLLAIDKLTEKFRWLYVVLLVVATHMCIESTHVQMVFNIFFGIGVYLLYQTILAAVKKEPVLPLLRTIGIFVVCAGLGVGMAADRYLSVQEYNAYSIRGTGPIVQGSDTKVKEGGGLDYDYATNWSFSPEEVMTFVVPGFYGNGVMPYPYKGQTVYAHSYWGQMPFTDLPNYMGIIVFLLAIYGVVTNWKDRRVQALAVMAVLALFISFGRNMSFVYDLMFNWMPFFNKFRAPSQILALVQFVVPICAGLGLFGIIKTIQTADEKRKKRLLMIAVGAPVIMVALFYIMSEGKDAYIAAVEGSQKSELPGEFVYNSAVADLVRCALFAAAFFAGAYFYSKNKITAGMLIGGAIVLTIIDLMVVDVRRMEIVPKKETTAQFQKTDITDFLKNDPSLFRIYDLSGAPNLPTAFNLQHVVGYHAAKMRIYQDMLDVAGVGDNGFVTQDFANLAARAHSSTGGPIVNPWMWNILNVKYIVAPTSPGPAYQPVFVSKQAKMAVFENTTMLPRAFFVDGYAVKPALDILNEMKHGSMNPRKLLYVEMDPNISVAPVDSTATVSVTGYGPQHITLQAHASGNNLLMLSEVYYKPAWKAYVDGVETSIIKADYIFRAIVVPQGTHTVEFKFESTSFAMGKTIALSTNILVVVAALGLLAVEFKRKREKSAA